MSTCSVLISVPAMRLLIVEDETDLRTGLDQALREAGYAVDTAADGKASIRLRPGITMPSCWM
jgi:CheY-like chemotaxis protein